MSRLKDWHAGVAVQISIEILVFVVVVIGLIHQMVVAAALVDERQILHICFRHVSIRQYGLEILPRRRLDVDVCYLNFGRLFLTQLLFCLRRDNPIMNISLAQGLSSVL